MIFLYVRNEIVQFIACKMDEPAASRAFHVVTLVAFMVSRIFKASWGILIKDIFINDLFVHQGFESSVDGRLAYAELFADIICSKVNTGVLLEELRYRFLLSCVVSAFFLHKDPMQI